MNDFREIGILERKAWLLGRLLKVNPLHWLDYFDVGGRCFLFILALTRSRDVSVSNSKL